MLQLAAGCSGPIPIRVTGYPDWKDKPFLKHEAMIFRADECCPGADFIFHTDSDCIFIEPVTPDDYFVNGKPVLMYAGYDWICKIEPTIRYWQEVSQKALGWRPPVETMRRHGAVHYFETYNLVRQCIKETQGMPINHPTSSPTGGFPKRGGRVPDYWGLCLEVHVG